MTLPLRRKHPTTAPNTQFQTIRRSAIASGVVLTALFCTAAVWSADAGSVEAPKRFVPSRGARPLQASSELTRSSRRNASRPAPSNSRVVKHKAVDITFIDDPEEKGGPAALRWRHSLQSGAPGTIVDDNVAQAQATSDDESGPYLAAPAVLQSDDEYDHPFREDLEVVQQPMENELQPEREEEVAPQALDPQSDSKQLPPKNQTDDLGDMNDGAAAPDPQFNNRDCVDEAQNCEEARERLKGRSIRQISLDISPLFNPSADERAQPPKERPRDFEKMNRKWHNSDGEVVAEGTLQGISNGRLLIRLKDGQVKEIVARELSDEDLCFFAAWWGIPTPCTLGKEEYVDRSFAPSTFTWKASALCHKPLYFEEVQLERYGHTTGPIFQPVISGAHFFLNMAALPYNAGIHPPTECQYALGYYRPGDCAPWLLPPIPLSTRRLRRVILYSRATLTG
jgi:hypothetical protein